MNAENKIAGLGVRKKAWWFDFFLGFFFQGIFFQTFFLDIIKINNEIVANLLTIVAIFIYWILIPFCCNGKTVGKFLFHLKIIDNSGKRLSMAQLFKRTLGYIVTMLFFLQKMRFDFDEAGFLYHDKISNTTVISE